MKTLPLRVCMLAYTFYENDGRVIRYAEALAQAGARVEVIALRREGQPRHERIHGVDVVRIQQREKNEKGKLQYLSRLARFFVRSAVEITRRHWRDRYDVIHVHSVPDFEVFAAAIPKMLGARLILDIHDIVPEFYAAKFKVGTDSLAFRVLRFIERRSARFADHVIIANHLWQRKLTGRAVEARKCSAYINYPDTRIFAPSLRRQRGQGPFVMIYPGTLNWHQGLDIAVEAFSIAIQQAPDMQFHIYGEGSAKAELQAQIDRLGLAHKVVLHAPVPLRQIAAVMAEADLGVVPKRNDAFGGDAFSTKVMEFMALGVPVLLSRTRVDAHYFDDTLVRFFEPGDARSLAAGMVEACMDREASSSRARRALDFARHNSWEEKSRDYLALVEGLAHAGS